MKNSSKIIYILSFVISILNSSQISNTPIIFLHGHESGGEPSKGWETWYPEDHSSYMKRILSEDYRGYKFGLESNGEIGWNYKAPSIIRRIKFELKYYIGIILGGEATSKYWDVTLDPFWIKYYFYRLNAGGVSLFYSLSKKWDLGIEGDYLHTKLRNRSGFFMIKDSLHYSINNFNIHIIRGAIVFKYLNSSNFGVAYYLSKTACLEVISNLKPISKRWRDRYGKGFGVFYKWERKALFSPFLKVEIGASREYHNTSCVKWKDKLIISLVGIYAGLKLKIGG